jgi:hypothetical protein
MLVELRVRVQVTAVRRKKVLYTVKRFSAFGARIINLEGTKSGIQQKNKFL